MVIIWNTLLEKDENEKWLGMGSSELLDYFNASGAVSSKHSYGPQGHRGMSLLIFEASAIGFIAAEQLSSLFEDDAIGKEAWARDSHSQNSFVPGGQRQLYGYMAEKGDLDSFNQHAHDKPLQKFEMRSYQEVVLSQLTQMSEENQLLILYKNKVEKLTKELEVLRGSFNTVGEKMRKVSEENRIVRERTKLHHKEIKEQMDEQEEFHRKTFKLVDDVRKETEEKLKMMQQEREETNQYMETLSAEYRQSRNRLETGSASILSQQKDTDIYAEERKLLKHQEQRMAELNMRQYEEKVKLEEEFSAEFARLMEKRNPH
ncbi:Protein SUPPRESSOR OF GENE SILENCING 3 [Heracleum sosnowskyi]|uniref:Protein SUPPRESSOR OF GENE SILENCING 3 n=1 Tax=Heracleum sosnowskyi TaxID=360622 RepID=A0AAD8N1G9_9APIA|nr:Protein SUPPRESSOR OF GENE SILENCING 3 [Heracleum sosnowskyi]